MVYDEVHALDGHEGSALQRLIRSMNCKFLALSATVGNAEELRGWMERVRGDYILGVESITVEDEDVLHLQQGMKAIKTSSDGDAVGGGGASNGIITNASTTISRVRIMKTLTNESKVVYNIDGNTTLLALKEKIVAIWPELVDPESQQKLHTRNAFQLIWNDKDLNNDQALLSSYGLFKPNTDDTTGNH